MEEYLPHIKLFKSAEAGINGREDVLLIDDERFLSAPEIEKVKVYPKSHTIVVVYKEMFFGSRLARYIIMKSCGQGMWWRLEYADENAPIELYSDESQYRVYARYKTSKGEYEILSLHTRILSVGPFSEEASNKALEFLKASKNPD